MEGKPALIEIVRISPKGVKYIDRLRPDDPRLKVGDRIDFKVKSSEPEEREPGQEG